MMKKLFLFPSLLLLFFGLNATSVSVETAHTVAVNFFKVTTANTNVNATLKYSRTEGDNTVDFYVFETSPAPGFVIVAGNTNTKPVIGYSTETNFNLNVPHAIGLNYWMSHAAARIHKGVILNVQPDDEINRLWNAYLNGQNPYPQRNGSVSPLLTTTWDQEPNYNAFCPYNTGDGQRAVTGCVATAMAQIMKYWAYPTRGRGSYSYTDAPPNFSGNYGTLSANFDTAFSWAQMPASINSTNNQIALLMYDLGVSVGMDYGDDNQGGSGAWVLQSEAGAGLPCSQYSYVNYFYYNPNTIQGIIKSQYSENDWLNMIKNELNSGRVVQYEGDDVNGGGGHTWVCDGYDAGGSLHMNWGWSGQSDGYFACTNLNAGQYNFDDNEAALIGIEPISPVNVTVSAINQAVCPGGTTTLTAQGPEDASFSWTPTTGLSCPTCATTTVSPGSTSIYTVTADSAGVTGAATISISITQAVSAGYEANQSSNCAVPATISFSNLSANANRYLWDFGDGFTDTATNPIHIYNSYGAFTIKLLSANNCGLDSLVRNHEVNITDLAPVAASQSICAGMTASLAATGTGIISWYDAATGGNLLGTGNMFVSPVLNNSTNYFVSSLIAPPANNAGPVDNTVGGGGYFTGTNQHGLWFNCTTPQTLKSVDVYAQTAGVRIISLEDSNGLTLMADTVTLAAGHSTVTLNFLIPQQNSLKLAISGTNGLYRNNSGGTYPYTSTDGTIVITNSDAGSPGYYYFFYNWKLQQPGCTTSTTVVPVSVLNGANSMFSANANGTIVNFSVAAGITSCTWSFGDGQSSTQLNPSHNYAGYGNYTVELIESNGNCNDTITQVVTLSETGITEVNSVDFLSLFPDPAHNLLNLNLTSNIANRDWKLIAYNILGQPVLTQEIEMLAGNNAVAVDISELSAGVHILSLQSGKTIINRRFVKVD